MQVKFKSKKDLIKRIVELKIENGKLRKLFIENKITKNDLSVISCLNNENY